MAIGERSGEEGWVCMCIYRGGGTKIEGGDEWEDKSDVKY